ncbi:hypothetical protein [Spirulina major]|nr:hypothetical protein [Spirulina major]
MSYFIGFLTQTNAAIASQKVTYDLARMLTPPVEPLKCSEFAQAIIDGF